MTSRTFSAQHKQQISNGYERDGFVFPVDAIPAKQALDWRHQMEDFQQRYRDDPALPMPLNDYLRHNAHLVSSLACQIGRDDRIIDCVEPILGPDILCWAVEIIIKDAHSSRVISWHQDLTYWGMGETPLEVTAWVALGEVTEANGCMHFIAGSHHRGQVRHEDSFDSENLLSRGQTIPDADLEESVPVILKPGQLSLHHGLMYHRSGPNTTSEQRVAAAIRYIRPDLKKTVGGKDYAMLVRGEDRYNNFHHVAGATQDFTQQDLQLYDAIAAVQEEALAEGAEQQLAY